MESRSDVFPMTIPMVSEQVLIALEEELRRLIASDTSQLALDIDDPIYGPSFRRFLLLSCWPSLLAGRVPDLERSSVFYTKYYWV